VFNAHLSYFSNVFWTKMVNFPIFNELQIKSYGLFPGSSSRPGLTIHFKSGLTLILGANGLGKTTLITIMYRILTGPYDIPGLAAQPELGSVRLQPKRIPSRDQSIFAQRVADGAKAATARLRFEIGKHTVLIERKLADLSLSVFQIDGQKFELEETAFQNEIAGLVNLWSFGDWILLLRHLVFYFEDRRALVWDPSAQRQLLRFLFLPPATAQEWTKDEREILALDSRIRNLNAALTREERAFAETELKAKSSPDIRKELVALEKLQESDLKSLELLEEDIVNLETNRQKARLRVLRAEQDQEAQFRESERIKLTAINASFPSASDTARYILAQLMTENVCLVCGKAVPAIAAKYSERIKDHICIVCNSDLSTERSAAKTIAKTEKKFKIANEKLAQSEKESEAARKLLNEAEGKYKTQLSDIQKLNTAIAERSSRIDALASRLPPDAVALRQQRAELATLRGRIAQLKEELASLRNSFKGFVDRVSRDIHTRSQRIKKSFDEYAQGFLIEVCRLTWSPQKDRLGQTGEMIDFPAFQLELAGADFPTPVLREGPDQVSESQREFIDLAFRMSLMAVAGTEERGSLVIDAPESSLDAVFVSRAAAVLSSFSKRKTGNRLIVTSNLVEGRLIPSLIKLARPKLRRGGIVDLFTVSRPTAATKKLKKEYDQVRKRLLKLPGKIV
jgi:hypothetical protein